jgi:hypothetical protein
MPEPTKVEIEDAIKMLEKSEGVTGGKRRKLRGGACSPAVKARIRVALLLSIASGVYVVGPEKIAAALSAGAEGVKDTIVRGANAVSSIECSVSYKNTEIQNAICSKYADLLQDTVKFVRTMSANTALTTLGAVLSGAGLSRAFTTFTSAVSAVAGAVKSTAKGAVDVVDAMVEELCMTLPDIGKTGTSEGVQTDVSGPITRSMTANMGGRRRTRRGKRSTKKRTMKKRYAFHY